MRAITMLPMLVALATLLPGREGQSSSPSKPGAARPPAPAQVVARDAVLFQTGHILLNDGKGTIADSLLAVGGKVLAVGRLADLEKRPEAAGAQRYDLHGAYAVPGLQDAHGHVASYGGSLVDVDLRGCASFDEVVDRVAARAKTEKAGAWILGRGWDQNLWKNPSFPVHTKLSERTPKNPVFLTRVDGHAGIANRLALAAAKLDQPYDVEPKVEGGRILLADGRPTGVMIDRGMDKVKACIPPPDRASVESRILAAQSKLLAYGLTCVHDMGTSRQELEILKDLRATGRLKIRVVSYFAGTDELTDAMVADLPLLPDAKDMLACPGVKLIADGALGSRGAALLADYSDAPGERGQMVLEPLQLSQRISICQKHGLQPAVHAIGDRANRIVLDVYETMETVNPSSRELRPRIEHAQVVALRDWPRFPALGVIPSMQPIHAVSDAPWAVARLGKDRVRGAYAWRALAPELRLLAFGSDFPVESPDPLPGLHAARARAGGESGDDASIPIEPLDGASALSGFTIGAAYACHQEDRRGRLMPGYGCDMTVLTVDPTSCDPDALTRARVLATIVNGEFVWKSQ